MLGTPRWLPMLLLAACPGNKDDTAPDTDAGDSDDTGVIEMPPPVGL